MKFAIIGHPLSEQNITKVPDGWKQEDNFIITPEIDFLKAKGFGISIHLSPKQMMQQPQEVVRRIILNACIYAKNELDADIIQLGGLTTSVTSGGMWVADQKEFKGYVNHGDSYTAAVTCQTVRKSLEYIKKNPNDLILSVVGAYGIIGEAVSRILVPEFNHSMLIGRREEKLKELSTRISGDFTTSVDMDTKNADVIVTATSHPTALIGSKHLKKDVIVVDVSQPPNLSIDVCKIRPDVFRLDGGFVDSPISNVPLMPPGKIFACIAEVIMQAIEEDRNNHVGSIDLEHLRKTEMWAVKHGFIFNEFTNFGIPVKNYRRKKIDDIER